MDGRFESQKDNVLARLRELAPLVARHRAEFDTKRRLSGAVIDALVAADLFRLWTPRNYGGAELAPRDLIDVIEEASAMDASFGWVLTNVATHSRLMGYLPAQTAADWAGQPDAAIAGSTGALGQATRVQGGYLVSGQWPYGSGVQTARRIMGLCKKEDASDDPALSLLCCFFAADQIRIIDNWHVSGLRGSGSCDFCVDAVFVPDAHCHAFINTVPVAPGMLFRLPILSLLPFSVALVPLGIARAAIAAFVDIATRTRGGTTLPLREREMIQADVARAEALRRSAKALVIDALADLETAMDLGGADLIAARAFFRVSLAHCGESCLRAVEMMAAAAGAAAIKEDCPLERCVRDVHAAVKHIAMAPHNFVVGGKVLLGLDPGTARF